MFRLADLLEICDETSLKRFEGLVQAAEERTKAALARSQDPRVKDCWERSVDYEQQFVVYLAVEGLAVHLTQFWSNGSGRYCPLKMSAGDPIIVPYVELEPLMKPGTLRDELLKPRLTP